MSQLPVRLDITSRGYREQGSPKEKDLKIRELMWKSMGKEIEEDGQEVYIAVETDNNVG